jgi:hypothetical protein
VTQRRVTCCDAHCRRRVARHEAGHFLVAYLMGLAPLAYTLSSLETYRRYGTFNVQAGCRFVEQQFKSEVASGQLSAAALDQYTCVALAGVAAEYVHFGQAEGGAGDLAQLDGLLKVLRVRILCYVMSSMRSTLSISLRLNCVDIVAIQTGWCGTLFALLPLPPLDVKAAVLPR